MFVATSSVKYSKTLKLLPLCLCRTDNEGLNLIGFHVFQEFIPRMKLDRLLPDLQDLQKPPEAECDNHH